MVFWSVTGRVVLVVKDEDPLSAYKIQAPCAVLIIDTAPQHHWHLSNSSSLRHPKGREYDRVTVWGVEFTGPAWSKFICSIEAPWISPTQIKRQKTSHTNWRGARKTKWSHPLPDDRVLQRFAVGGGITGRVMLHPCHYHSADFYIVDFLHADGSYVIGANVPQLKFYDIVNAPCLMEPQFMVNTNPVPDTKQLYVIDPDGEYAVYYGGVCKSTISFLHALTITPT
ncbi:hypothetical protein BJ138DRAFT_1130127 [Hygrophoropsis aurantiaca]|uniref:Uncharacterized protein n=1 Tax=Hygrophoropsis aurantiaca TaxID=72124 RepID=A0ACB8A0G6_9AGAM|nr:hypothetical protein BJ138DRAFT_1130127 [Hygrophoropsis aurantiaca]